MEPSSLMTELKLGAKLKQAREQQGLSIEEVAATLKLLPRIISHLESNNYQALPQTVFVKGYLRLYAELLALPVQEVYADFEAQYQQPNVVITAPVVLDINVLPELENHQSASASNWQYKIKTKSSRSWLGYGLGLVLLAAMIIGVWQSRHIREANVAVDSVASSQQQGVISLPNVTTTRAVTDVLQLQFSADTKVSIKDANGTELANNTQKAGGTLTVQGESPFAIELNPASAVQFNFNDKPIDLKPYTVNDAVNFRLSR